MLPLSNKSKYFERMLQHKATSYKLFWLRAILEEVQHNQSQLISFDRLVCRMISEAWYPLVKYHLNFGHQDQLQRIVDYVVSHSEFSSKTRKEIVLEAIYLSETFQRDGEFQKLKRQFYDMVPYRLINPFFSDQTKGIKDQKKNRLIEELATDSSDCFYKFELDENTRVKYIYIKDDWITYIYENYAVLRGWLDSKLILYLQVKNPSVPNIPLKIDRQETRRLQRATEYWKLMNWNGGFQDIYTSEFMTKENMEKFGAFSIDHYIPWSFVMHDELWITIPTFKNINSSKSDGLPNIEKYLDEYCMKHYHAFTVTKGRYRGKPKKKGILEDYMNLGGKLSSIEILNDDVVLDPNIFVEAMKETIVPLYQIAHNQGFELWESHC